MEDVWPLDVLFPLRCVACACAGEAFCGTCTRALKPLRFSIGRLSCRAVGAYEGRLRLAVLRVKGGRRDVGECLGQLLAEQVAAAFGCQVPLVPLPTVSVRRRERGFDQSRLLAYSAARKLGCRVLELLGRTTADAQRGRSRMQRLAATRRFVLLAASAPLQGAAVVLVDDVATSGATLHCAAATLEGAGAHVVGAAVVARAERRFIQ